MKEVGKIIGAPEDSSFSEFKDDLVFFNSGTSKVVGPFCAETLTSQSTTRLFANELFYSDVGLLSESEISILTSSSDETVIEYLLYDGERFPSMVFPGYQNYQGSISFISSGGIVEILNMFDNSSRKVQVPDRVLNSLISRISTKKMSWTFW